jgi:hypothetical protein
VASVAHVGPIHLGLDVHKNTISVAILTHDRDGPDVERIATTRHQSAGSLAAFLIPGCCEPATRPARPAMSWPGCCKAWTCAAR